MKQKVDHLPESLGNKREGGPGLLCGLGGPRWTRPTQPREPLPPWFGKGVPEIRFLDGRPLGSSHPAPTPWAGLTQPARHVVARRQPCVQP